MKNAMKQTITVDTTKPIPISILLGFKLEDMSKQGGGFPVLFDPGVKRVVIEIDDASYSPNSKFTRSIVVAQGVDKKHLVGPINANVGTTPGGNDLAKQMTQVGVGGTLGTISHNDNSKPSATKVGAGHKVFYTLDLFEPAGQDHDSLAFFIQ